MEKPKIKEKVMKAIKVAEQYKVGILCFSELSFEEDFIDEKNHIKNLSSFVVLFMFKIILMFAR